jgi:tetratricopeptide (TPR) repeat protein
MEVRDTPEPVAIRRALAEVEGQLFGRATDPVRISRYVLLDRIGAGGAGVVYSAYDPELERKVAIKLLHPAPGGARDTDETEAQARLLREAQAMAKLSHPNVITVHDVGTYAEDELPLGKASRHLPASGVFVVMELFEGSDFATWLEEARRSWREVLRVFVAAGRGLAAAHDKGLVHRDFKPANLLLDEAGRVRVLDFGLARFLGRQESEATIASRGEEDDAASPPEATLTQAGTVMGTPPYMAPEQHHGQDTDERTDQYAFCVALFEGLYGKRPFAGRTLDELRSAKDAGAAQAAPAQAQVPAWVHRALLRGLSTDPAQRFPSMAALLAQLERDPARRRWRFAAAGAVVVVAAGVGVGGSRWYESRVEACRGHEARLVGIWDDATRASVAEAFRATRKPYAEDVIASVDRVLDEYTARWTTMRTEACEATVLRAEVVPDVMERRILCLDRRLAGVEELTGLYAGSGPEVIENALRAANALPRLEPCMDEASLLSEDLPVEPGRRQKVDAVELEIARGQMLLDAGKYREGVEVAESALEQARRIGHMPTTARALLLRGRLETQVGDGVAAEKTLFEAFLAAERAGSHDIATRSLIARIGVTQHVLGEYEQAERIAGQAAAKLAQQGLGDEVEAMLAYEVGVLRTEQSRYEEALASLENALALRQRALGPDHPETAIALAAVGSVLYKQRKFAEAEAHARRALAAWEKAVGPEHPYLGDGLKRLGNIAWRQGRYDKALAHHRRAYAIDRAARGAEHPSTASRLMGIANVLGEMGRRDDAVEAQRQVVAIYEQAYGGEHPWLADALGNLGSHLVDAGQYDEAESVLRRALTIQEEGRGRDHPQVAYPLLGLGRLYRLQGRPEHAILHLQRAIDVWTKELGPRHPKLSWVMHSLGEAQLALGRTEAAIISLEQATKLHDESVADPLDLADIQFALARAEWTRDQGRARALAKQALDAYQDSPFGSEQHAAVRVWLHAHGGSPDDER